MPRNSILSRLERSSRYFAMGETTTLSVHRCRFVDFTPSSITALAFPPLPLPSIKRKGKNKVAPAGRVPNLIVGHANGNIEIYEWTGSTETVEAPQAWVVRKVRVQSFTYWSVALKQILPQTLSGPNPSKVDSLALALKRPDDLKENDVPSLTDLRLFSSGGGSELTEWDMVHGAIRVGDKPIFRMRSSCLLYSENVVLTRRGYLVNWRKPCFHGSCTGLRGRFHNSFILGIRHPSTSSPSRPFKESYLSTGLGTTIAAGEWRAYLDCTRGRRQ